MADQTRSARRLRDAGVARRLGSDQAHRRTSRLCDDRREIREADPMITLEMMPPLMFGGLVLSMLIGYGYNIRYITGVLAASGTITQLVPPSLVLIVLADQLGKSVGDMYLGAWGPSVFQILLFAGYTFLLSIFKPSHVPAVPKTALTLTGWPLWRKCLLRIIPSPVLIFRGLGTRMLGLATPT